MKLKELYFTSKGRLNRKHFILATLPILAINIAAALVDASSGSSVVRIGEASVGIFQVLTNLLTLWPGIALGIKRLHDRDKKGWFIALSYVPLVNLWIAIELLFLKGKEGENTFGPDPLQTV